MKTFILFVALFLLSLGTSEAWDRRRCKFRRLVRLNPKGLFDSRRFGYSQITVDVLTGTAHISGQTALDAMPNPQLTAKLSFGDQFQRAVNNLRVALQAVYTRPGNVIMVRTFVVDYRKEYLPYLAALGKSLDNVSHTVVGVEKLAVPGLLVEIEASATVSRQYVHFLLRNMCHG